MGQCDGLCAEVEETKSGKKKGVRREGGEIMGEEVEKPREGKVVKLQAVMLWSAGSVKIWEYEEALEMRKGIEVAAK